MDSGRAVPCGVMPFLCHAVPFVSFLGQFIFAPEPFESLGICFVYKLSFMSCSMNADAGSVRERAS